MIIVSNDPAWWSVINADRLGSCFVVATLVAVMYDWALTFGQEVELIWASRVWCQRNTHENKLDSRDNNGL
ncbi:hypothetical protein BDR06DRAFT_587516 [Suillus hirtellus]|nr:hypothetical protein BDR06DRAFT_587516 [Suillus hirtellus]